MSTELIGIIAASIALGTALLASMRGLRQEMRDMRSELREEIKASDHSLREEIKASNRSLREEIKAGDGSLREEMNAADASIREEMRAGFKELSARMVDIGDRLSKIEGIMEGMFWSRNQPPDKPRGGRRLGSGVRACHLRSRLTGDLGPPDRGGPVRRVPCAGRSLVRRVPVAGGAASFLDLLARHQLGESVALVVRRAETAVT